MTGTKIYAGQDLDQDYFKISILLRKKSYILAPLKNYHLTFINFNTVNLKRERIIKFLHFWLIRYPVLTESLFLLKTPLLKIIM
jgi:hypothetical protein